jgi:O-antigen/teichoic acid export membrane protein
MANWSELSRGRKYALVQSQVLTIALVAVVIVLLATHGLAVFAVVLGVYMVAMYGWVIWRIRRRANKEPG